MSSRRSPYKFIIVVCIEGFKKNQFKELGVILLRQADAGHNKIHRGEVGIHR